MTLRSAACLALFFAACGESVSQDDGGVPQDAGAVEDAGPVDDAGTPPADAGTLDAGTPDAGAPDAGTKDAGEPVSDAGPGRFTFEPGELVFSAVKGTVTASQAITVTNVGGASLTLPFASLAGTNAAAFHLDAGGGTLMAGGQKEWSVAFAPDSGQVGLLTARVQWATDGGLVSLFGLATNGEQGNNEPPLQRCVDALGYAIDVGGTGLIIGTANMPLGDEVLQPLFHRADAGGPVTLVPVARYSPDETLPFGWYLPLGDGGTTRSLVGTIALGQDQTLNPKLTPDSGSTFEPGTQAFGIYVHSNSFMRDSFTQNALNTGPTSHACRVYPLKNRGGQPIAHSYLLAFEDAANGDYQDYVFVLGNAEP